MTRKRDHTETESARRTLGEIEHTNPYTDETAGHLFRRGPVLTTDGGRAEEDEETEQEIKDGSHTPPNDSEDANRVFERGRRSTETEEE